MPVRNIDQNTWFPGSSVRVNKLTGVIENLTIPKAKYEGLEWVTNVTPNYFVKKQQGIYLGNNPLRWAKSHHDGVNGSFEYKIPSIDPSTWLARYGAYGLDDAGFTLFDYPEPSSSEWTSMYNQANSSALQRMKNSKVNLAVSMAESRETAGTITGLATRIAKAGLALKKGNYSGALNQLGVRGMRTKEKKFRKDFPSNQSKAVSSGWLELQYGWAPLLSDIYGAAEHLAYRSEKRERSSGRGQSSGTQSYSSVEAVNSVSKTGFGDYSCEVVVCCHYSLTSNVLSEMGQLGFTNPQEVAWELVPYSFVVDWFLPIGTYLSNMDASFGKSFLGGTSTEIWNQKVTTTVKGLGGTTWYTGTGVGSKNRKRVYMSTLLSFPSNPVPRLVNPFSPTRALNAMALLRQAFK